MKHSRPLLICLFALGILAAFFWKLTARIPTEPRPKEPPPAPVGLTKRIPWTTSRLHGTPDPPPPYRTEAMFPLLKFTNAVVISSAPGTDRFFVGEQGGKIFSFPNDPACESPDLMLDLREELRKLPPESEVKGLESLYGLTFHPEFEKNRYCYVCYVVTSRPGYQMPDGSRVSRFKVTDTNPPTIDPASEQIVITWLQGGHNGGCLKFGPDGCLYISTGDGGFAFPPDALQSGQDVSNLLSSILRIDVDHPEEGKAYSIPKDNPFVSHANARGEIWCFGLRNPWRMSFDRTTGDLWVGDVGWELWELIYKVKKGGNYGWSVVEGRQPVHPERKVGPTPILPPTIEISHTDGVSVTGGFVYRGQRFPELVGTYIYGDWETRRVWGAKWDEATKTMSASRDLVDPVVRLVDFAEDHAGELYLMDYDNGSIHRLERNEAPTTAQAFPSKLSETGLFTSVARHQLAPGVQPFSVNAEQWSDHAQAERFIALPDKSTVTIFPKKMRVAGSMFDSSMIYPNDSVLGKTLSLEMEHGDPNTRRRIETQVMHFDGKFWRGYSYRWNDEQTDAELIDANGSDIVLNVVDEKAPGGRREQAWHFSSRMECARCHNQWTEYSLAFNTRQLNKNHTYAGVSDNQLRSLENIGILRFAETPTAKPVTNVQPLRSPETYAEKYPHFTNPYDVTANLDQRARTYLHVNCAHCHRNGGGGTAYIELQQELSLDGLKALDVRPTQGHFEIADARILAAGDPFRSTLFYRVSKTGAGRMPHIGSEIADEQAVRLLHDWIRQLPIRTDELAIFQRLKGLDEDAAVADETKKAEARIKQEAQRLANLRRDQQTPRSISVRDNKPPPPAKITDEDLAAAKITDQENVAKRAADRAKNRADAIQQLLSSTSRALLLAQRLENETIPTSIRDEILATATSHSDARIRDLFEKFMDPAQRPKRLGRALKPADVLALAGNPERGRELYFGKTLQCKTCHRIDKEGGMVGPDLTAIGKKHPRPQLLESILEPSKVIDPKYVSYVVETADGQLHTGLLVGKTETEVVLRNAKDQEVRLPLRDVEQLLPSRQSLMPDLQLRDLSLPQVADLLAFLETLK